MKKDTSEILRTVPRSKTQAPELPARPPYIVGVNLQELYLEATEMLSKPKKQKKPYEYVPFVSEYHIFIWFFWFFWF
jgi:hypothetical protein